MVDEGARRRPVGSTSTSTASRSSTATADDETGTQYIHVAPHPDTGDRVALWERHPDHPTGEVFIHGQDGRPVEVAVTPAVLEALAPTGERGEGSPRLVRLEGKALEQREAVAEAFAEKAAASRTLATVTRQVDPPGDPVDEQARAKQIEDLQAKVRELEASVGEARDEYAVALDEEEEKRHSDPDTIEKNAAENERLGRLIKNQAALTTYDAEEPKQGIDANTRRPRTAGRSNVARPMPLRDDAAGRSNPTVAQSAVPPPSDPTDADPKR